MRWFEGSVEEAVKQIRAQNALFVVFIGDDDEKSVAMLRSLESVPDIEGNDVVALQLRPATLPFRQFSQIYPVSTIPASFIITSNGAILKVIDQNDDDHSTRTKVTDALRVHRNASKNGPAVTEPEASVKRQSIPKTVVNTDNSSEQEARQRRQPKSQESLKQKKRKDDTSVVTGSKPVEKPTVEPPRTDIVRLQFRLPDGSSVVHRFEGPTNLGDVFKFVKEVVRPSFGAFSLHVAFPNRELNPGESQSSLQDLGLAPSAAIMVIPSNKALSTSSTTFGLLWTIIGSILNGFRTLGSYITGMWSSSPSAATNVNAESNGMDETKESRSGVKRGGASHLYGNVHRLASQDSDSDENNTWNGNSTQQM
jgi:hypothetical protein